eukprot:CAMPEP_0115155264 /NCGR_PEP_ID=MMETSP0227-20121206/67792_1 /TAXON_ID=89957 /ORGANISM="Polarella glacialis, Strain CCMP 1383" /LENGTH=57 /DNA_ID=CAMNT_0002566309 /DNA_START=235 /DNA_END=405 /DNA_ORIENTATION=+
MSRLVAGTSSPSQPLARPRAKEPARTKVEPGTAAAPRFTAARKRGASGGLESPSAAG